MDEATTAAIERVRELVERPSTGPDERLPIRHRDAVLLLTAAEAAAWRPTHRHVKRATDYQVIRHMVHLQTDKPVSDMEPLTIYQQADGCWWARPVVEFSDGRFVRLPPEPTEGSKDAEP